MYQRGLVERIRRTANMLFIQKVIFSSLILLSYLTLVGETFTKNEVFIWLNGFFSFGVLLLTFSFAFSYFEINDIHLVLPNKWFKVLFSIFSGIYILDFVYLVLEKTINLSDYHEFVFYTVIMMTLLLISLLLLVMTLFYKKDLQFSSDEELLNRFLEKNIGVKNLNVVEKALVQKQNFPSFFILLIYLVIGGFEQQVPISIPVLGVTMIYYIYKTTVAAKIEGRRKYILYFATLGLTLLFISLYIMSSSGLYDFGINYSDIQFAGLSIMLPFYIFRLINNKDVYLLNIYHFLATEMINAEEQRLKESGMDISEINSALDEIIKGSQIDVDALNVVEDEHDESDEDEEDWYNHFWFRWHNIKYLRGY